MVRLSNCLKSYTKLSDLCLLYKALSTPADQEDDILHRKNNSKKILTFYGHLDITIKWCCISYNAKNMMYIYVSKNLLLQHQSEDPDRHH